MDTAVSTPAHKFQPQYIPIKKKYPYGGPLLVQTKCSTCNIRENCLPRGLDSSEARHADQLVQLRIRVKRGASLYRIGDPFKSLYAIRTGFFKTCAVAQDGREQITCLQMPGDFLGLDGIEDNFHNSNVVALEDSEVCVIHIGRINDISVQVPKLHHELTRMMSREIVRDRHIMTMLGTMRAEERVATFLLNLSQRFSMLGYSSSEFHLRMKRDEIGNYLGLTLETISRIFSKFQHYGLLMVHNKHIHILDRIKLKALLNKSMMEPIQ